MKWNNLLLIFNRYKQTVTILLLNAAVYILTIKFEDNPKFLPWVHLYMFYGYFPLRNIINDNKPMGFYIAT